MVHKWRSPLPGPSRLSQILANLRRAPRPGLPSLRALRLTLAQKNEHFGARHFLKEDLPRIRYANPRLDITVDKKPKTAEEAWSPELVLEFADGRVEKLNVDNLWSSDILQRVLDAAGGDSWTRWKDARAAQGLPALDPPEPRPPPPPPKAANPFRLRTREPKAKGAAAAEDDPFADTDVAKPDFSKTGAAVVLP